MYNIDFQNIDMILIFIYLFILLQVAFFAKISKKNKISVSLFFLASYFIKIIMVFFFIDNAFYVLRYESLFSEYDATNYYMETIYMVATQNSFIPKLHWSVANPGFHYLLYWIGKVYTFFFHGIHLSYLHFIYFLIFIHTLTFFYMYIELEKRQQLSKVGVTALFLFTFFEPMMLRFAFSLEREIFVSFSLLIFIIGYMNNKRLIIILSAAVLIFFRDVYIYLIPTCFLANFVYSKFFKGRFLLFLIIIIISFSMLINILAIYSEDLNSLFFHQVKEAGTSGIGDIILSIGYFLRIIIYSILGFVAPIPIYPFFKSEYSSFYVLAFIMGLGSISYLFMSSYIIYYLHRINTYTKKYKKNIKNKLALYDPVYKAYIVIFMLHLAFHGLIFNVRHRLQIIPSLIYVFVYIINLQNYKEVIFFKISLIKWLYMSVFTIFSLNILYIIIKFYI